ncbi:MAG: transposase [Acidobacteriota bacterium]
MVCFVTVCCAAKKPILEAQPYARAIENSFTQAFTSKGCPVMAYAIMPNHVHLLLRNEGADLISTIGEWKSHSTQLLWRLGLEGPLWQRSFYDHFLRKEEDVETVAIYIAQNPARAGLPLDRRYAWHQWMTGRARRPAPTEGAKSGPPGEGPPCPPIGP